MSLAMHSVTSVLCFTLFCYSVLCADINVSIWNSSLISHVGPTDVHFITDEEKVNFGLTLATVQSFSKKRWPNLELPDQVAYKNPVKCGDFERPLYTELVQVQGNGKGGVIITPFQPVRTSVRFVSGSVQEVTSQPEIVATQVCHNRRSNITITCKFALTAKRTNSVSTTWTTSLGVSSEASVTIGVEEVFGVGGRLEVSAGWEGSAGTQLTTELGTELGGETPVAPLQAVHVQLVSQVGRMRVQLEYEATVSGDLMKCSRWYTVEELLEHIGRNATVRGTMVVDVKVYSKASLVVSDEETGESVKFH